MGNLVSSIAVESYEIIAKVGSHKVYALVTFKPVIANLGENLVELYMGVDSLSAPMKFFICGVGKLKTAAQKEEFASNIVNSHATILLPYLIRWNDCIDSLGKEEVRKAMKLKEHTAYAMDEALDLLKAEYPKMKFGSILGRFEKQ